MRGFFGDFGTLGGDLTYTVQPGDSLSKISMKYFNDYSHVQAIADANGIDDVNMIDVGDLLTIPGVPADETPYNPPSPPAAYPGGSPTSPILTPIPGSQSPVFLPPTTQPTIPYTQPITLPGNNSSIPYNQPTYLPGSPAVTPSPTPAAPSSSFNIWSLFPSSTGPAKKILGLTPTQLGVATLSVLGLGMLVAAKNRLPGMAAKANPRRRRR